ncbi:universal stress protein [Flectobacillus major]|uniref:universal stress protein n=1 Tax=Flectobacillus major TaxID=103 RepID=UPI000412F179|nr:universal stress protein [Flectobacillus major]
MKIILLPTDFSANAKHAANFAVSLAELINAKIVILHAYAPPVSTTPFVIPLPQQGLMQEALEETKDALEEFKQFVTQQTSAEIETKLVFGNAVDNIIEATEKLEVDFVVIGSIGTGGILSNIFGSTALSVVQKAQIPVWVVPQNAKIQNIKNVLYTTDLEGDEISCINKLIKISELLGIEQTKAVHVKEYLTPEVFPSSDIIAMLEEEYQGERIVFRNLHRDDTITGIDTYIKNQKPDAVVVAQRPKGLLERLFRESVLKHLTLTSQIPLLVLQKKY